MLRSFLLLALAIAGASTLGCGPSVDPNLEKPCKERGERSVVVGTGEEDFEPLGSEVLVQAGPQGGYHIWMGLSCKNLGPKVTAKLGVSDTDTGELISESGLSQVVELEYDSDTSTDRAAGIYGYLAIYDEETDEGGGGGGVDLTGRHLTLWADVNDSCKVSAHGESRVTVSGYDY